MKLSTIRTIDYWAGVPICILLDIFAFLISPFIPKGKRIKNVLFIELSEAGSLIIAYSAIKRMKEAVYDANLYFLVFQRHANGLKILNIIDERNIITIRDDTLLNFLMDTFNAVRKIWSFGIDTVIDMELFSRATSVLTFFAFAMKRAGFYAYTSEGLYRGRFIHNYKVSYNFYKHMSLNFMALVETVLDGRNDSPNLKRCLTDNMVTPLKLIPTHSSLDNTVSLVRQKYPSFQSKHNLIIVNPNAGELPIRAWELWKFAEAAKRILNQDENNIVAVIGLHNTMQDGVFMEKYVNSPRCVNLIGMTKSLGDVIDLCHLSKLVITNDSGPAQYASLTNAHVVVFFGPETPKLYGPLGDKVHCMYSDFSCSPCLTAINHRNTVCSDNKCLQVITVDKVLELCFKLLEEEK